MQEKLAKLVLLNLIEMSIYHCQQLKTGIGRVYLGKEWGGGGEGGREGGKNVVTYNIVEKVENDKEIDDEEDRGYPNLIVGLHEHIRVAEDRATTKQTPPAAHVQCIASTQVLYCCEYAVVGCQLMLQ